MTTSPIAATDTTLEKRQRRWVRPTLYAVGGIVLLVVGIVIGIATQQSTITSYKHQVAALQSQLKVTKGNLAAEQTRVSIAQTNAQNAMSAALTQVRGQYKAKFATLQAQEQAVAKTRAKLDRELGIVAKSTISADGVYVIGRDIPPGIYHTSGGNQCYYALLNSTDTNNISDNNIVSGPATVNLNGVVAFNISGGCTWHKIG